MVSVGGGLCPGGVSVQRDSLSGGLCLGEGDSVRVTVGVSPYHDRMNMHEHP